MKLPRWLVIAMLTTSALSVVAVFGWHWVTWPERNAREVVCWIEDREYQDPNASPPFGLTDVEIFLLAENHVKGRQTTTLKNLRSQPRTGWDVIRGEHRFVIAGEVALTAHPWGVEIGTFDIDDSMRWEWWREPPDPIRPRKIRDRRTDDPADENLLNRVVAGPP